MEDLENEVNKARKDVEENPSIDSNIKLKETTARLRRETISTQRKGWQEKTASLNLEKRRRQTLESYGKAERRKNKIRARSPRKRR